MGVTTMERREQLAYLSLYYALHNDDEKSRKMRHALNQLNAKMQEKNTVKK